MRPTRRGILQGIVAAPLGAQIRAGAPTILLPDKKSFPFEGTYLNAAFSHPLGAHARAAGQAYLQARTYEVDRSWPRVNARDAAVAAFAGLINASPSEIAVVTSTMEGENLIAAAIGLGPEAGVVTDAFHYDASLAMYGELQRTGVPVKVVSPRNNVMDLRDFETAIGKGTRLVAVSLVSSQTGFKHDLKSLCEIAHAKGAMVYADIIQAVGAISLDVRESGVDFCSCGTYKWLMGDFGTGFLYVRADRLDSLRRVQLGWRQLASSGHHVYPFDSPGPAIGNWALRKDTVGRFEVGTPNWFALSVVTASIGYIQEIGMSAIVKHRQPMLDRLQEELPKLGFQPLTSALGSPTAAFASKDVARRFGPALTAARIKISVYENMIRISPSVYNDMEDIERLLRVFRS
jgi:selenocysteine lyase/cysteine desulfurase